MSVAPADPLLQRSLLSTRIGLPGSGAARYGAAMYFYQQGEMSAQLLEIYRRCCKLDNEDPLDLARFEGVACAAPAT